MRRSVGKAQLESYIAPDNKELVEIRVVASGRVIHRGSKYDTDAARAAVERWELETAVDVSDG